MEALPTTRELGWRDGNQDLLLRGRKRECCVQPGIKIVIAEGFLQRREGGFAGAVARSDVLDLGPIM
jgi:hypothetical protein